MCAVAVLLVLISSLISSVNQLDWVPVIFRIRLLADLLTYEILTG